MSNQAGAHQQPSNVLDLTQRQMSCPEALKWGVPPQTAARIQTLHLSLHDTEDLLPEWLDILSSMFFHLEHLYILEPTCSTPCASPRGSEMLRMRRLYILYRLPGLQTIDGKAVTELERSLARPDTPNGQRVKRDEWLPQESLMDNLDDDEEEEDESSANENQNPERVSRRSHKYRHRHHVSVKHGDVVEVSLQGAVRRVHVDPLLVDSMDVEERRSKKGELKSSRRRRVVAPEETNNDELKPRRRRHRKTSVPRQVDEEEEERQQLLLEMESVVSPQHQWSAACGGLTFTYCGNDTQYRSGGLCGRPKIRLQFGRSKKAIGNGDENEEDSLSPETKQVVEKKTKKTREEKRKIPSEVAD